jgi:L-lactate dehydrogenase complex protein LldG
MMSDTARENIMRKLTAAVADRPAEIPETGALPIPALCQAEKIEQLKHFMQSVRGEVHVVKAKDWVSRLQDLLRPRALKTLLYGPATPHGKILAAGWPPEDPGLPRLVPYAGPVEDFKSELFQLDAGITGTLGAIAENGALILWPTPEEPRLISLVPPIHIALVDAGNIYCNFSDALTAGSWKAGMPTNALLISGPSKTADIELTLAFGVHGPREVLVLVLEA